MIKLKTFAPKLAAAVKFWTPAERMAMAETLSRYAVALATWTDPPKLTKAERRYCKLEGIPPKQFIARKLGKG